LGILYEQINLRDKAEQFYLEALQNDRDYLPTYMNLGYLYLQSGEKEKAFQYFKIRYEMGNPDDQWGMKAKEAVASVSSETGLSRRELYRVWLKNLKEG